MDEYIKREATIERLKKNLYASNPGSFSYLCYQDAINSVQEIPPADVVPVRHGRWIVRFDGPYKRRRCYCSHCGRHNGVGGIAQNQEKPYCPNCGAKMDGEP